MACLALSFEIGSKNVDGIDASLQDNGSLFSTATDQEESEDSPVHDLKALLRVRKECFDTKEEYQEAVKEAVNETKVEVPFANDHPRRGQTFDVYVCQSCDYHTSKAKAMARHLLDAHKIASIACDYPMGDTFCSARFRDGRWAKYRTHLREVHEVVIE